ncbi:MAG: hypothetical protein NTV22_04970 [bacterium]|nr:hypothetical protein [bacterium]
MLGTLLTIEAALHGKKCWWIAPSYSQGTVAWRELRRMCRAIPGVTVSVALRTLYTNAGGFMAVKSADRPDLLRGEGLDLAVLDEAAFMPREVWADVVRPALSDRLGRALIISTPHGRGWYHELYQRGRAGDPDFTSFHYPTSSNPFIDPREIAAARRELPARVFSQEYEAAFIEDGAGVFRGLADCTAGTPEPPLPGLPYVAGIDLARTHDYTCIVILDASRGHVVHLDRMNMLSWAAQRDRIGATLRKYDARALVDATGVGDPVVEEMRRTGLAVTGLRFDHANKVRLIEQLMLATENRTVTWPAEYETLTNEMAAYEASTTRSGLTSYNAPEGLHDDTVIGLALAMEAARKWGREPLDLQALADCLPI